MKWVRCRSTYMNQTIVRFHIGLHDASAVVDDDGSFGWCSGNVLAVQGRCRGFFRDGGSWNNGRNNMVKQCVLQVELPLLGLEVAHDSSVELSKRIVSRCKHSDVFGCRERIDKIGRRHKIDKRGKGFGKADSDVHDILSADRCCEEEGCGKRELHCRIVLETV